MKHLINDEQTFPRHSFKIIFGKTTSIQEIKLKGLITDLTRNFRMDWYNNNLLLPENLGGYLFTVTKNEVQNQLASIKEVIEPTKTIFNTPNYSKIIPGFDGFEALAFEGDNVYVTIEAGQNDMMTSYIVWGSINPSSYEITIPEKNIKKFDTPIQIDNMSYESIIYHKNDLLLMYEANGSNLRKNPYQLSVSLNDFSMNKIKGSNIEYR